MSTHLCVSIRFLQPFSHGRGDEGEPQWPPSPLRLFQALVASAAGHWNERTELVHALPALRWLEAQPHPTIAADIAAPSDYPYRLYVPDNVTDKVATSWSRGRDADIADYRVDKDVRTTYLSGEAVHYLYLLPHGTCPHLDILTAAARSITHLGWGIDMVVGDASILTDEQAGQLHGVRWQPSHVGGTPLRAPKTGTLDDLIRKHRDFLNRVTDDGFRPVPPLRVFDVIRYRSQHEPAQHPYRVFELRKADGSRFRYSHRKLIHLAGMTRHLAKEAMQASPPVGVDDDWVETYIVGHVKDSEQEHRQLSYLPLPSVGHPHTDPGVRRVMVMAPLGDDGWLDHLARHLAGRQLEPLRGDEFGNGDWPYLVPLPQQLHDKGVLACYTKPSSVWHSFTPVILPGHDDHKPEKTRRLIERALQQSGIDQPCEFEWSAFSRFPQALSAHKYDRNGRLAGYLRPDHLLSQTPVHLTLRFKDGLEVPGPLAIGAGRHCGLGLFVSAEYF